MTMDESSALFAAQNLHANAK